MNETLIIRLPDSDQQVVPWLVANLQTKDLIASGELESMQQLNELRSHAENRQVKVYVTTDAVTLHQLDLPAKSRKQLAQVVPYALEDDVAQEIDSLHFAWASGIPPEQPLPVAVVDKQTMQLWQQRLAEAGIRADSLQPDCFAIPVEPQTWSVMTIAGDIIVRQGAWQGIALEPDFLQFLEPENERDTPVKIKHWGQIEWPQAPAQLEPQDESLPLQAAMLATTDGINLLQGQYQLRNRSSLNWSVLKWPGIAAAIVLALGIADNSIQLYKLNAEQARIQQQTEQLYRDAFPDETRIVNIRAQLNQHLARLGGTSQSDMLYLLQSLESAFSQAPLNVTSMQYDASRNELRIQADADSFQVFEQFRTAARGARLDVEQGQLVSRSGVISGTLTVREAS